VISALTFRLDSARCSTNDLRTLRQRAMTSRIRAMIGELLYVAHRMRRAIILAVPAVGTVMMAAVAQHYHLLP
jgi:hypothetical protein